MSENENLNTASSTRTGEGRHVFHTNRNGGLLSYDGDGGEVKVPDGIKYILEEAFAFCNHVTSVILPEGVQAIAKRAFFKSGIRTITLPNSLTRIQECAFSDTPLESIYIPDQAIKLNTRGMSITLLRMEERLGSQSKYYHRREVLSNRKGLFKRGRLLYNTDDRIGTIRGGDG